MQGSDGRANRTILIAILNRVANVSYRVACQHCFFRMIAGEREHLQRTNHDGRGNDNFFLFSPFSSIEIIRFVVDKIAVEFVNTILSIGFARSNCWPQVFIQP